jgi:rhodanese-related sulfurtransferase
MTNAVLAIAPANSAEALVHFGNKLAFETDCWDVHEAMKSADPGFVLLDVRGPGAYAEAHLPGALNIPHRTMTAERMDAFPASTVFVVYCAGPHCNGADKAALRLARLGRPVKMMIGGIAGWRDEGFGLAASSQVE